MNTVFLNGTYLPREQAMVSVEDRGFLFADAIYESTPVYRGRLFLYDRHMKRLERGLGVLRIDYDVSVMAEIHDKLIVESGLAEVPLGYIYVQITRGVAPRGHAFPKTSPTPTVYAFAGSMAPPTRERWDEGFDAITVPDRRWARADVKTTALTANVLAQQAAVEAGVSDAVLVRDGMAMEGSHNNLFAVLNGVVVTAPASNYILHGITRGYVIELAQELGLPLEERPLPVEELMQADEVFYTGTTTEIRPTVRIDGKPVGTGQPGPISRQLYELYVRRANGNA
ncbi:MAG: D-alanine transaminase [Gammaproteobacteria bacterium]|jgi:D-alanine transaminase